MTKETCEDSIDVTEETVGSLIHLVDEGYKGAQEELDRRIKSLPDR
jgi:hypothetical protein